MFVCSFWTNFLFLTCCHPWSRRSCRQCYVSGRMLRKSCQLCHRTCASKQRRCWLFCWKNERETKQAMKKTIIYSQARPHNFNALRKKRRNTKKNNKKIKMLTGNLRRDFIRDTATCPSVDSGRGKVIIGVGCSRPIESRCCCPRLTAPNPRSGTWGNVSVAVEPERGIAWWAAGRVALSWNLMQIWSNLFTIIHGQKIVLRSHIIKRHQTDKQ